MDRFGNLYIADQYHGLIRKVDTNGTISTIAGVGSNESFSGDGGPATNAELWLKNDPSDIGPAQIAMDGAGNVYFTDVLNQRVRRIDTDGIITTVAGNGSEISSGDGGPATSASLSFPEGVAIGVDGSLFIADYTGMRIRRVVLPHPVSEVATPIGSEVVLASTVSLPDGTATASVQVTFDICTDRRYDGPRCGGNANRRCDAVPSRLQSRAAPNLLRGQHNSNFRRSSTSMLFVAGGPLR